MNRGSIRSSEGDVVVAAGLVGVAAGDLVALAERALGIARLLRRDEVAIALLERGRGLRPGASVVPIGPLTVPVGEPLRGRVVDALGRPLDGGTTLTDTAVVPVPLRAPGLRARAPLLRPLISGIKAADLLLPLRHGMCVAVAGPPRVGKTDLLLTTTMAQKGTGQRCFFCMVGGEPAELAQLVDTLRRSGCLAYTTILAAYASAPLAMQVLAPFVAMAMAAHERARGGHALVLIDGLTQHAAAFARLQAALYAVPSGQIGSAEVHALQAALLDPAGPLVAAHGGGSLSVLFSVEEPDPMAGAPLHILPLVDRVWRLDAQRFREGQRPALIPPRCVSKLAPDCARPLQRTAGSLRLGLALGDELRAVAALPDALDEAARRRLTASERIRHLLRQPAATPVRLELEVALAVAGAAGILDRVPLDQIAAFEAQLADKLGAAAVAMAINQVLPPQIRATLEGLARAVAQQLPAARRGG